MLIDTALHSLLTSRAFETDTENCYPEEGHILHTVANQYDSFTTGDIFMDTLLSSNVMKDIVDAISRDRITKRPTNIQSLDLLH